MDGTGEGETTYDSAGEARWQRRLNEVSRMLYPDTIYTARMNDAQKAWFYAEYDQARRDATAGVLLAIFLGGFGIHHFYLRRVGLGILYLLFSWTGIPTIAGWVECFLMPTRVREYNAQEAGMIASQILSQGAVPPATMVPGTDMG